MLIVGFRDDRTHNTFGVIKKGHYRPLSDFNFDYLTKVKAKKACSTGYMIKVTPETTRRRNETSEDEDEDEDEVSSRLITQSYFKLAIV